MLVISDTSPICYLVLIGEIDLLHQIYTQVLIPQVVQEELLNEKSPIEVQNWINNPPHWLIIKNIDVDTKPSKRNHFQRKIKFIKYIPHLNNFHRIKIFFIC